MQSINYITKEFAVVSNLTDFYKTKLPEMTKVRSIFDNLKILFKIPTDRIILGVIEGERVYKFTLLSPDITKQPFGWFVYIPEARRLDMYVIDTPMAPIVQWVNKKPVFTNYPLMYDRVGFDKLYSKVVNLT